MDEYEVSMSNYKSKNHNKFTLKYHIIFVCKYRNWTNGYFCSTIGEVSSKTLEKYIQNQG